MKKAIMAVLFSTVTIFICLSFEIRAKTTEVNSRGFALIELFTSEGCSSCPPAEAAMHESIQKATSNGVPVYVIEFHVDYWDYLGWKDTFAMHDYSQRQQDYGDFMKLNSIYTPQAIINGKTEMVGSDEDNVNATVAKELQDPASAKIVCNVHKTDNSKIEAEYTVTGNISGCELNFVVVESNLTTYVKKGENAHKTLTHDNAARIFKSVKLNSATGKIELDVPHVNLANAKLICYVQNISSKVIIGALQTSIAQ